MSYKCPRGHESTDSDYCSECGSLIGESIISNLEITESQNIGDTSAKEICPDCGTERSFGARFCEVCRHDFQENKTGVAEVIIASKQTDKIIVNSDDRTKEQASSKSADMNKQADDNSSLSDNFIMPENLNIIISVDRAKADSCDIETSIKPDDKERVFPLDLNENLVGRRSAKKGIYPEIEISDPGVSHRHLKFIKQSDGKFAVLELGSSNGTELNGKALEPGIYTPIKAGDELQIGIWSKLKVVLR